MQERAKQPEACPQGAVPGLDPQVYAKWRATALGAITERLERRLMLELIGDVAGKRVLEVGCGDGALAVELARRGARVTGIDGSPRMIEAARDSAAAAGVAIELTTGPAEALPLADGSFDLIVAQTILCFVADGSPAFAEIGRVLAPGGRLVIGELGRWSSWAAERRIRAWLGSPLWRRGRFRTPGELRRLATGAGLVPGPVKGAVYYPRLELLARWMEPLDQRLSQLTTLGAAFLAVSAMKPQQRPADEQV
ncbi:MAG: methyltransferase domain-containing protein [Hyphomicrobiaceae bacterium]